MSGYKTCCACCIFFLIWLGSIVPAVAQVGFHLPANKKKDKLQFELINNLAIVPVEVNGKKLSFLLDTGVNFTLLFSLYESDSLTLKNAVPTKIRGLGDGGDIDALKSINNVVKIGNAVDKDHKIYVIFDQKINFSPRMGVPVHGVIGYDFFKDMVAEIDYYSEQLTMHNPSYYTPKKCRKCEEFNIGIVENKPYIRTKINALGKDYDVTMLMDTGASDALWLFNENIGITETPKNYFNDFLGLGLSGAVNGKRSKLDKFTLGTFELNQVNVSYPDSTALRNLESIGQRNGTIGSDIWKRFTMIINYRTKKVVLKKNGFFNKSFNYNMSGIVVEHRGMVPVKDVTTLPSEGISLVRNPGATSGVIINVNPFYTFFLAPKLVIAEVRSDSPAAMVDIRVGDELISVNGKEFYDLKLQEINAVFTSKEGRRITLVIERNGIRMKKKFVLQKLL